MDAFGRAVKLLCCGPGEDICEPVEFGRAHPGCKMKNAKVTMLNTDYAFRTAVGDTIMSAGQHFLGTSFEPRNLSAPAERRFRFLGLA